MEQAIGCDTCSDAFEPLKRAFLHNFSEHGETGAACAVFHRGRCVLDIWAGHVDVSKSQAWSRDTIQLVFSAAKGVTTIALLTLVDEGTLDLDAPIARYWPEFGRHGKEQITVRQAMSHRAGLAALDAELTLEDIYAWQPVIEAIEEQRPNWPPGEFHGYHARTFGWILGEVLKRLTGVSVGTYLRERIAGPLGLDMWIGLPASELGRCARIIPPSSAIDVSELLGANSLTARVMNGPSGLFRYDEMWNSVELLQAEMPSSNLVTDARSLARLYSALSVPADAGSAPLVSAQTLKDACRERSEGPDKVILQETYFASGFMLPPTLAPASKPSAFGLPGAGGSLGFADPEHEIAFGYVTNTMRFDPDGDPRVEALLAVLYECL